MPKFTVNVKAEVSTAITLEANDADDAYSKVESAIDNGELDYSVDDASDETFFGLDDAIMWDSGPVDIQGLPTEVA